MFETTDIIAYWILLFTLAIVVFISVRKSRSLKSPRKELIQLRTALIIFGITAAFVYFWSPSFSYYFTTIDEGATLTELNAAVAHQNQQLEEFGRDAKRLMINLSFLLLITGSLVAPAIYNFARAIVPDGPKDFSLLDFRSE